MKIKDKKIGRLVLVADKDCSCRKCYWPRPDPGVFTQGVGYKARAGGSAGWLCGTREAHGCPDVFSINGNCASARSDEDFESASP